MSDKIAYGEWVKLFAKFPILKAKSKREDVNLAKKEARIALSQMILSERKITISQEQIRKVLNNMRSRFNSF